MADPNDSAELGLLRDRSEAGRWRRIHIIGGPGSGKTTLARRLAFLLSTPVYDLDVVGYEDGAGARRSLEMRLADAERIAVQPAWIAEGIYLWWTDGLLNAADLVVWLDPPWRVAAWRIVLRHLRASLAGTNRHPGLSNLAVFLFRTWHYYHSQAPLSPDVLDEDTAITRSATRLHIEPYADRLVRCRRPAELKALIGRVETSRRPESNASLQ